MRLEHERARSRLSLIQERSSPAIDHRCQPLVRSLLAGALDHLAKPFNVRVLMAKLQRWTTIARCCQVAA